MKAPPPTLRVRARHMLTPLQRLILYELWFESNAGTRPVEFGQGTFGERIGVGRKAVRGALSAIRDLGWLDIVSPGPPEPTVIEFTANLDDAIDAAGVERDRAACLRGRSRARTRYQGNDAHDLRVVLNRDDLPGEPAKE